MRRNSTRAGVPGGGGAGQAQDRARRPKPAKLAVNAELRGWVEGKLELKWSPEQVSAEAAGGSSRTGRRCGCRTRRSTSRCTCRAAGALRRELAASLRTGRALRKPRRTAGRAAGQDPRHGQHQRAARGGSGPGGARALGGRPDHRARAASPRSGPWSSGRPGSPCWSRCRTARPPAAVADALVPVIGGAAGRAAPVADLGPGQGDDRPPADRGRRRRARSTSATRTHPGSGAATRTPTGCCASTSPRAPTSPPTPQRLQAVADELNGRPRKTLGWKTPAEALAELLDEPGRLTARERRRLAPPLTTGKGRRASYGAAPPASRLLGTAARRPCGRP